MQELLEETTKYKHCKNIIKSLQLHVLFILLFNKSEQLFLKGKNWLGIYLFFSSMLDYALWGKPLIKNFKC